MQRMKNVYVERCIYNAVINTPCPNIHIHRLKMPEKYFKIQKKKKQKQNL